MGRKLIAGIETGGTKLLARVCDLAGGEVVAEARWQTSSPESAFNDISELLRTAAAEGELAAIGMAAFGPLVVDPSSPDYGLMLSTTKPGWTGSNLRADLAERFNVPVSVDSDVNSAAIAEQAIGAGEGLASIAYVTVGTGIGAGLSVNGRSLRGALHPEAGHLPVIRRSEDELESVCRFHVNCAEGLCSGPAINKRLGEGRELAGDLELMELVADYLGQLTASLVMAWSPCRIVWGGGIIKAAPLVPLIEKQLRAALGGYGVGPAVEQPGFCVKAELENAGLDGALILARNIAELRQ